MKTKILFINDSLAGGGTEKLLNDLLPLINSEKYICELLILTDKGQKYVENLHKNGIKVTVVPDVCATHIKKILFIKKYIANGSYDIIHANLFPVIYYCALIKRISGGRFPHLVMTEHNTDNRRRQFGLFRSIERFIYSSYEYVISISQQVQDNLLEWLKKTSSNTSFIVIHNGIPLKHFIDAKPYDRRELVPQLKEDDILLCIVGSFSPRKNQTVMIKAMKDLPEKYKLILIGEEAPHEKREKLELQAIKMNLQSRVFFLGFRKDVAEIMKTSDIIIVPSKVDGFGLVAAEAMACEKPVVVSDIPGLRDIVGDAGLKAQPDDSKDFCEKIMKLSEDKVYKKWAQKAFVNSKNYDIENMADKYERLYRALNGND